MTVMNLMEKKFQINTIWMNKKCSHPINRWAWLLLASAGSLQYHISSETMSDTASQRSCHIVPLSPLPFYRWTWPPQKTYGNTPPQSPELFCPLLLSSPSLSFHEMVIAQQSSHKWDSPVPSSQGWVCISGCSTLLGLWKRKMSLMTMFDIGRKREQ